MTLDLIIRSFQPQDQSAVQALILEGLQERWNVLDPLKNPDLVDIVSSYSGGCFRVAVTDGRIVGTGALIPYAEGVAEICRMSVARELRRRGIGSAILHRLMEDAESHGYRKIILETTSTWKDAVSFYQKHGFRITHHQGGDTHFLLELKLGYASVV
jgi:ribosomal protein S18 acetylase RimI-like enzyme